MTIKQITSYLVLAFACIILLSAIGSVISFSNQEIELRNGFDQKMSERTAFYDKMWKTINQKGQIAVKNDSSFRANVDIIMQGRKDAPQVAFKWITESNPNANYSEVSALYKDLSRAVEAQREGFFMQEKVLQDYVRQHTNHIKRFPNSLFNMAFGRQPLEYKPITSDRTDAVIKTGKDNETGVF